MAEPARERLSDVFSGSWVPSLRAPGSILDMVNYQMNRISHLNAANVRRLCEGEFGITRTEWEFVSLLHALGPTSPSDLAACARLDRSLSSKTLKSLRDKKLVHRRLNPGDGRHALMELTKAGQGLHSKLLPRVSELNHALLDALSADQIDEFAVQLSKLARRAQELVHSNLVDAAANRRLGGSRRHWPVPG